MCYVLFELLSLGNSFCLSLILCSLCSCPASRPSFLSTWLNSGVNIPTRTCRQDSKLLGLVCTDCNTSRRLTFNCCTAAWNMHVFWEDTGIPRGNLSRPGSKCKLHTEGCKAYIQWKTGQQNDGFSACSYQKRRYELHQNFGQGSGENFEYLSNNSASLQHRKVCLTGVIGYSLSEATGSLQLSMNHEESLSCLSQGEWLT